MKSIDLCIARFDDETKESFKDLYTKVDAGVEKILNEDEENPLILIKKSYVRVEFKVQVLIYNSDSVHTKPKLVIIGKTIEFNLAYHYNRCELSVCKFKS